eukprot:6193961-Pleurochrysis_carterae.AAC.1
MVNLSRTSSSESSRCAHTESGADGSVSVARRGRGGAVCGWCGSVRRGVAASSFAAARWVVPCTAMRARGRCGARGRMLREAVCVREGVCAR